MSKRTKDFLKDNWHLVLVVASFVLMLGKENQTRLVVAAVMLAVVVVVDVFSTSVIRSQVRSISDAIKLKASVLLDKGGDVLENAGKELDELANEIRD